MEKIWPLKCIYHPHLFPLMALAIVRPMALFLMLFIHVYSLLVVASFGCDDCALGPSSVVQFFESFLV